MRHNNDGTLLKYQIFKKLKILKTISKVVSMSSTNPYIKMYNYCQLKKLLNMHTSNTTQKLFFSFSHHIFRTSLNAFKDNGNLIKYFISFKNKTKCVLWGGNQQVFPLHTFYFFKLLIICINITCTYCTTQMQIL